MISSRAVTALVALVVLVVVQGCGLDPLVHDDEGALRSSISIADVETAALPSCDCLEVEFLESELLEWAVVPVHGAEDASVIVANGQAVCTDRVDDGPTPEPSNPEDDHRITAGPTPEPSNPTGDHGLVLGPTPEPSTESRVYMIGPTPEPSKDSQFTNESYAASVGPTPEPSIR